MFNHVMVGTNDIEKSRSFYDAVLGTLGVGQPYRHVNETGQTRFFYRHNGGIFCITEPINGESASVGNGSTIGFKCHSAEQVNQFHDVAVAQGGVSIEDPPGERQGSLGPMHVAYVRDLDGHKLCAIYRPA